ncbi:MAG: hypothetical protein ACFHXK_16660 [bacterium]
MAKKTAIVLAALLLVGIGLLYRADSATVADAEDVLSFMLDYCKTHGAYPDTKNLNTAYPELFAQQDWYYWPNDTFTQATYQYPMTLPLPHAPGSAKLSEFFPVIYAYAHRNPCGDLSIN